MIKISSILIAKNEEHNIARCVESQIECIDEIVVLIDKDSSDKTLDIVKSYGKVKYQVVEWKGYSGTKQFGLSLTSNDWIFWIDADEAITPALKEELNAFKKSSPENQAYSVPRKAYFLGRWIKHCGWYPGRIIRLFDKNKVSFSDKTVHEGLVVNGATGKLDSDLEHYTDPTIHHYFKKFNKYTSLAAEELFKERKSVSMNDIVLRPAFIFFKMYLLKLGFLDGLQGFILSVFSSAYVFTKYCKLWELRKNKGKLNGTK